MNLAEAFNQTFAGTSAKQPKKSDRIQPATPLNMRGAFEAATNIPVVGDALSGGMAVYDAVKGDYPSAAMNALGVLPFVSGTFIGKGAKTWDAVKASEAEKRLAAGDDVRKVWKETGTFKGPDGHLRQEIDDSVSKYNPNAYKQREFYVFGKPAGKGSVANVSELLDHKKLVNSYPDLSGVSVREIPSGARNDVYGTGEYSEATDSIGIGTAVPNNGEGVADSLLDFASDKDKPILLHELQHAIQQREGWAKGGSADIFASKNDTLSHYGSAFEKANIGYHEARDAGGIHPVTGLSAKTYAENRTALLSKIDELKAEGAGLDPHEAYRRLAGEAEARATQARMNMNMEQRLNTYPLDSYDVPVDQLIIRGNTPLSKAFGAK